MMHKEVHVRVQVPGQGGLHELMMVVYPKEIRVRVQVPGQCRLQELVIVAYSK